jgi:GAF domain-containing protein
MSMAIRDEVQVITTDSVDLNGPPAQTVGDAMRSAVPLLAGYLDDIAIRTDERLGSVSGVAVTLSVGDAPMTVGSSSQLALDTDLLQYSIGVGPCLHALQTGRGMYVADLAHDDRWRDYGPRAAALGAAACVSAPVLVDGDPLAVIKVYSSVVDGISADQREIVALAAVEISGGIRLARHLATQAGELDDRASAMNTRRTIDLAIGILMERNQASAAQSFDLVRQYSQHYNLKLNDAARQIVAGIAESPAESAPFKRRGQRY